MTPKYVRSPGPTGVCSKVQKTRSGSVWSVHDVSGRFVSSRACFAYFCLLFQIQRQEEALEEDQAEVVRTSIFIFPKPVSTKLTDE